MPNLALLLWVFSSLNCLEFPQWPASDKAVQLPNAIYRHAIELTFQEKPGIIKLRSGI